MFSDIKQLLTIRQVVEHYQGSSKRNKVVCPFHADKTPSLHIYDKTQTYQCFVCRAGGDLINFVARLHNCNNLESAKILNQDFHLGLDLQTHKIDKKKVEEAKKQHEIQEQQRKAKLNQYFQTLAEYEYWRQIKEALTPIRGYPPLKGYAIACNELQLIEFKLDRT